MLSNNRKTYWIKKHIYKDIVKSWVMDGRGERKEPDRKPHPECSFLSQSNEFYCYQKANSFGFGGNRWTYRCQVNGAQENYPNNHGVWHSTTSNRPTRAPPPIRRHHSCPHSMSQQHWISLFPELHDFDWQFDILLLSHDSIMSIGRHS